MATPRMRTAERVLEIIKAEDPDTEVTLYYLRQMIRAEAVPVARQAAQDTSRLTAKIGRARPQAARGVGTPDAGAVSLALCLEASGLDDCS